MGMGPKNMQKTASVDENRIPIITWRTLLTKKSFLPDLVLVLML